MPHRMQDFSYATERPWGRTLGRSLDPLDQRDGWPANGVEVTGALFLDSKKDALQAAKAEAVARADAIEAAKAKAELMQQRGPQAGSNNYDREGKDGGLFSLDGAKAAVPYVLVAVVVVLVGAHFLKGGA